MIAQPLQLEMVQLHQYLAVRHHGTPQLRRATTHGPRSLGKDGHPPVFIQLQVGHVGIDL
jgi:hypothetical protein